MREMMTTQNLVTTQWLAAHLDDDKLRVVDIRGRVLPASEPPPHYFSHRAAYDEAHIPGAVFVDWMTDIVEPGSPANDVASPERYAALMGQLGIGDETLVVAYDDAQGMFAARLWWTLRYYGHDDVAVLDGGWHKWSHEARPVTSEVPDIMPATFTPRIQPAWRKTADEVAQRAADVIVLDVRSPAEFAGEASRAARKGRIPNAVNIPRKWLVADDHTLYSPDILRQRFAEAGIALDAPEVIVYCNSGVSASYGLLALQAAGLTGGSVYDGSWKEWGSDETRPIE